MTNDYEENYHHRAIISDCSEGLASNTRPVSGLASNMRPVSYIRSPCAQRIRRWRSGGCSETMERLMRLVVAQGETIQNQLRRLNQRESQIESYEQQMHLLRVQSLGNDYLLSSYLHDPHHPTQEYPHVSHNPELGSDATSGSRLTTNRNPLLPTARLQNNPQSNPHTLSQGNRGLLPGMADAREVHAKPINILGEPNDLYIHDGVSRNVADRHNPIRHAKLSEPFRNSGRFISSNKDDTTSEEKSNDSGVVIGEECLTSAEGRGHRKIEDLNEAEVQERLLFFTKMENILSRLLEEEEKIHGLRSTIEVIQTQQKREKTELEYDLNRAAEDHSALVAEARSNEQQIRAVDTSAVQKKKLIDALLADEVDSDQETKYLQAKLDYILNLPPTAFRLPEEGDDPPPLPPPPAHPACLVQSLLHNQPPQLVQPISASSRHCSPNQSQMTPHPSMKSQPSPNNYFHCRSSSGDNRPSYGAVHRAPSPNVLYGNRAPSPSIIIGSNRAPSPGVRMPNRSCSPNRRKPLQPPPYDYHKFHNGDLILTDSSSVPILRNPAIAIRNSNIQSQVNNIKHCNGSSSLKNSLTSGGVLPTKSDICISNNKSISTSENLSRSTESTLINQRTDIVSSKSCDENELDTPPPLPLSPPPLLTPPMSNSNHAFSKASRTLGSGNDNKTTDFIKNEATKRNLLNTIGSRIVNTHSSKTGDDDDNDSTTNNSSIGVSSRSSTSSEASISNCSSSVSSGVCIESYHSNNINKMQRLHNQISTVTSNSTSSKLKPTLLLPEKTIPVTEESVHHRTNSLASRGGNDSKKDADSADSNSDTGLSSLHSSSDEAGYALDTLV